MIPLRCWEPKIKNKKNFCKDSEPADPFKLSVVRSRCRRQLVVSRAAQWLAECWLQATYLCLKFGLNAWSITFRVIVPLPLALSGNCLKRFAFYWSISQSQAIPRLLSRGAAVAIETNFGMTWLWMISIPKIHWVKCRTLPREDFSTFGINNTV